MLFTAPIDIDPSPIPLIKTELDKSTIFNVTTVVSLPELNADWLASITETHLTESIPDIAQSRWDKTSSRITTSGAYYSVYQPDRVFNYALYKTPNWEEDWDGWVTNVKGHTTLSDEQ